MKKKTIIKRVEGNNKGVTEVLDEFTFDEMFHKFMTFKKTHSILKIMLLRLGHVQTF